jgi:hypothetical protein
MRSLTSRVTAGGLSAFLCLEAPLTGDVYSGDGGISGLHYIVAALLGLAFARPVIWKWFKSWRARRVGEAEAADRE